MIERCNDWNRLVILYNLIIKSIIKYFKPENENTEKSAAFIYEKKSFYIWTFCSIFIDVFTMMIKTVPRRKIKTYKNRVLFFIYLRTLYLYFTLFPSC
jgi:hypothetical protein